ncbi:MAG TPA: ornithine cyclodeaminase family protein [Candidatus Sulfotelmatobacter sp.]|nr:ornithine cyclodeaminase family protein [Candidatus Sulfotelmatobacter sp.]
MRIIDDRAVERRLALPLLIERLRAAFRADASVPLRHHHAIEVPDAAAGTLLLMPAWIAGGCLAIKLVTVFPDNQRRSLSTVLASVLLLSATTGEALALVAGRVLTVRRTAAASALAASYLARADAAHLVMVGTGALAPALIAAHAAVRPIRRVSVWGRDPAKARGLADRLAGQAFAIAPVDDLEAAVRTADIVSCATLTRDPLVRGEWLAPGAHLDLVGGFTPAMREADDTAIRRAAVFVDTRAGATKEAGDIVQPLASGVLAREAIRADLHDLARGRAPGRAAPDEITLFKSVGTALEDLAAAQLAYEGEVPG